ncbi:MAG TPA: plastocyanin/azurin family copper-binding protein [Dehalococcoidia bacterium]|nr:plastocyanin/azurin family copper-binding protein [Dehalococcoidia bacterium]
MRPRASKRRLLFALILLTVTAAMACGSGDAETDAYGESNPVQIESDEVTVEMTSLQFEPQGIRVRPGTTVTWVNNDPVIHNVRQVESEFLSPDVASGEAYTFRFKKPGRYRYQCTYHHPNMSGVVILEP